MMTEARAMTLVDLLCSRRAADTLPEAIEATATAAGVTAAEVRTALAIVAGVTGSGAP